jgi:membrane-associated phospholipid phosphatase
MIFLLQMGLWQKLEHWDQWLFIQLNSVLTNPFFDTIMPFLRNSLNWTPLYLFLGVFVLLNFRARGGWWCVFFVATAALTDMTGTYIFKHNIERLRPCSDPDFFFHVRLLVDYCSGGYSFVSNHAANHFGLAAFFFITMKHVLKKWALIGFVWAALIAYAQVYVGLHYPLDVLVGSLLGLAFGTLTGTQFNKRYGIVIFGDQPTLSS